MSVNLPMEFGGTQTLTFSRVEVYLVGSKGLTQIDWGIHRFPRLQLNPIGQERPRVQAGEDRTQSQAPSQRNKPLGVRRKQRESCITV